VFVCHIAWSRAGPVIEVDVAVLVAGLTTGVDVVGPRGLVPRRLFIHRGRVVGALELVRRELAALIRPSPSNDGADAMHAEPL
jgi:hypothetical protein